MRPIRSAAVEALHNVNGVLLVVVNGVAGGIGLLFVRRGVDPPRLFTHLLALGQTLLVAQVALGLLLLADDRRTSDELHYLYGALALLAVLAPWVYAPRDWPRRLAWFAGASLLAAALGIRGYLTGS
jgi:hypothetical protein